MAVILKPLDWTFDLMIRYRLPQFAALVLIGLALFGVSAAHSQLFETKATQAFMIDAETGTVLFAKDADALIPPASLGKLMAMEVVFNELKSGRLTLNDTFPVSENAWRVGGAPSGTSTMFAEIKSSIQIEDLIQGVVIQSANDGCIILAEGISGSEENFAKLMTERARLIGLPKSVFKNSNGLPAEGQLVTVRELALLARHIWSEYPEYYKYYSRPDFTWNNIFQRNRNPLLTMEIGADGMKTGFTEESGYAIVGSVNREGRRVFAALSGLTSEKERAEEARKLLDWGMSAFKRNQLFAADEIIGEARVYGGSKSEVALKANAPVNVFFPVESSDRLIARIVYEGPLVAPVAEGTRVGFLRVWIGDTMSQETPLFTAESVGPGKLPERALDALGELLIGWLR